MSFGKERVVESQSEHDPPERPLTGSSADTGLDGPGMVRSTPRKPRLVWAGLAVGLIVMVASAAVLLSGISSSQAGDDAVTHTVTSGDLFVTVTERGTVESSKNTEIKCEIRGGYGGRGGQSTVTWVIPTGTVVQPGDELVRLDTKIIEETISLGKTDTNLAKAALARTVADVAIAKVSSSGYLEGRYRSQMKSLQKELVIATRNLKTAQKMLDQTELLFKRSFANELKVEAIGYTVAQAELELKVKQTEIDVLSRLTRAMELETLNGQVIATRARLDGRKAGLALEQGRLDLALEEFERCVIKAPKSGLVIYPSTAKWKDVPDITEGASVHNNQVLLLMPDLSQMQVKIEIHESIIARVKPGLAARVTLPDRTLETTVSSVAAVARPAGWWTGNVVKYDTTIQLPSVRGLKPGMTAEVEVIVAWHENVLSVPVAAVLETEQGYCCWVETAAGAQRRSVELGDSGFHGLSAKRSVDAEFIVVEAGLKAGDKVILDPLDSIEEARELVASTRVHTVTRGDLLATLREQGALESSNNTQIKCRVRGNSTINWVIENGTQVKPGDELVRLENKQIEEYLHERTKFAHLSRDAAVGFRAQATVAGLAISEYLEGRYRTELMRLQKDMAISDERLLTAQNMFEYSLWMFERGYESELDVEERQLSVNDAEAAVDIKLTEIDVLKRFTKNEELATLRGNWESAKAAANGHEEVLAMDGKRMALATEEIQRCVIQAPKSGLVIYPSTAKWKDTPDIAEGETVHNDQVLLLMPDLSKMQVKFGIHESKIDRIKPGMIARVTLPDRTLQGKVASVSSAAQPSGWWTGNIVKYDAIIQLPSVDGLKPGMSAEVEVIMDRHKDVLIIPFSAVVETSEGSFCWVQTTAGVEKRSLKLGDRNSEFTVVDSGVQEGDKVILDPQLFVEEARTPST